MPDVTAYLESNKDLIKSDVEICEGQDYEWIIDSVEWVTLSNMGQTDSKWALHFRGQSKMFPLNKTNCRMVAENLGSKDTDDWVGRKVVLYRSTVQSSQGKIVPCIRIREAGYVPAAAGAPDPQGEEDIPF